MTSDTAGETLLHGRGALYTAAGAPPLTRLSILVFMSLAAFQRYATTSAYGWSSLRGILSVWSYKGFGCWS